MATGKIINIRGKEHILLDETIEAMDKTSRLAGDKEEGFALCERDGQIFVGTGCKGDNCSVEPLKRACKDSVDVGFFHTHPLRSSDPSIEDLLGAMNHYLRGLTIGFDCRAGDNDNYIRCSIVKDDDIKTQVVTLLETYEEASEKRNMFKNDAKLYPKFYDLFEHTEFERKKDETRQDKKIKLDFDFVDKIIDAASLRSALSKRDIRNIGSTKKKMFDHKISKKYPKGVYRGFYPRRV